MPRNTVSRAALTLHRVFWTSGVHGLQADCFHAGPADWLPSSASGGGTRPVPEPSQQAAYRQPSTPAAVDSAETNVSAPAALAAGTTPSGALAAMAEHACRSQAGMQASMRPIGSFDARQAVHTRVSPSATAAFRLRGVSAPSSRRPISLSSQRPVARAPPKPSRSQQPAVCTVVAASPFAASEDPRRAAPANRTGEAGFDGPIYPSHMLDAVPDAARGSRSTIAEQLPGRLAALTEVEALVHCGDFTSAHANCGAAAFVDGPGR